jgi:hypothetical protein
MPKITVVPSDGHVWNAQEALLQIVRAHDTNVIIDLLGEGPCCQTSGIDDLLDRSGVDRSLVVIETSNQIKSSRYPEKRMNFVELDFAKNLACRAAPTISTMGNIFALFIGRSNWQRLGIASHLYNYHRDYSKITFHYDPKSDYHKDNFGLEQYLRSNWGDRSIWNFVEKLPIKSNDMNYPILWDQGAFDLEPQYQDVFCEIVCETYFTGRTFFITEKTWRPIINMRPFVVQGPQWYLDNLRRLGFRTFDRWWDEGYDQDPSDARLDTLRGNIDWIASQPRRDLEKWYQEMQPTLLHNLETLKNLTQLKILTTDFRHE